MNLDTRARIWAFLYTPAEAWIVLISFLLRIKCKVTLDFTDNE